MQNKKKLAKVVAAALLVSATSAALCSPPVWANSRNPYSNVGTSSGVSFGQTQSVGEGQSDAESQSTSVSTLGWESGESQGTSVSSGGISTLGVGTTASSALSEEALTARLQRLIGEYGIGGFSAELVKHLAGATWDGVKRLVIDADEWVSKEGHRLSVDSINGIMMGGDTAYQWKEGDNVWIGRTSSTTIEENEEIGYANSRIYGAFQSDNASASTDTITSRLDNKRLIIGSISYSGDYGDGNTVELSGLYEGSTFSDSDVMGYNASWKDENNGYLAEAVYRVNADSNGVSVVTTTYNIYDSLDFSKSTYEETYYSDEPNIVRDGNKLADWIYEDMQSRIVD